MLTYILEYVDDGSGIFDMDDLRDGYRQFYGKMRQADPEMYLLLEGLREDLITRHLLPVGQGWQA